jgi:transposase
MDVASEWVDIAVIENNNVVEQWRCARSEASLRESAERLRQRQVIGVVLEPTGKLEVMVGIALAAAGIAAFRINAKRIRDFARAHGVLAKTDRVDARVLARFGQRMRPEPRMWLDADRQQLAEWIARQRQLVDLRTAESNRLHRTTAIALRRSIERTLRFLEKELKRVETELSLWWDEHACAWHESEARLRTMPGVGPKTARVLIALLPELGRANRRQIASLAGLAPIACESGNWRGQRHIRGGRAVVRSALYLASWTAVRRAGTFRAFYEGLVARGKPRQLALIAVARRMLTVLNDMLRSGRDWQERVIFT